MSLVDLFPGLATAGSSEKSAWGSATWKEIPSVLGDLLTLQVPSAPGTTKAAVCVAEVSNASSRCLAEFGNACDVPLLNPSEAWGELRKRAETGYSQNPENSRV